MFDSIRKLLSGLRGEQAEEAVRRLPERPTNMSRRGFFRAVGITTATVVLTPSLVKACPCQRCLLEAQWERRAIDAVNDFTRTKMREDGFYHRLVPPIPIPDSELDRQIDTDKPVKTVEKLSTIQVQPFGVLPNKYITGPRYRVSDHILTLPPHTCGKGVVLSRDTDELRVWTLPL